MAILNPFPQVNYALEKSLGLWLSIWAIRYNAGVDYKLGAKARAIRWMLVVCCFALTSLPGAEIGWFRVSSYLAGLGFLCWPNLAYHVSKRFEQWPTVEGRVDSVDQSGSQWKVAYDFEVAGERFGGCDNVKSNARNVSEAPTEGERIVIRYDPLNPSRSSRIQLDGAH
jgi:uncharacterized protein DUF3592